MDPHSLWRRWAIIQFAILAAALVGPTMGQVVIGPPRMTSLPSAPSAPAGVPAATQPGALATLESKFGKQGPLFRWRQLVIHSTSGYTILRSDGLLRVPGQPVNTTQHSFSQTFSFELGSTWTLSTNYSYVTYSNPLLVDNPNADASLSGRWTLGEWRLGLSHQFDANSPIVVETGGQTKERTNSTTATASREIGSKTSLQVVLSRGMRKANSLAKSTATTWTGSDWNQTGVSTSANYQATNRVRLSLGYSYGYDEISNNPDISHYSTQGQINWQPANKWSVSFGGGKDHRTTRGTNGATSNTPIYNASVNYSPTLTTKLSVVGSKTISTSYFNDQSMENETWSASASQRLLRNYFFSAGYSEGRSNYVTNVNGGPRRRPDRFTSTNASLSAAIGSRGSVAVNYGVSRNKSPDPLYGFSTHSLSANLGYRF